MNSISPSVTNLGNLGGMSGMFSLTLNKIADRWIGLSVGIFTNKLFKINFQTSCSANLSFSTEIAPTNISYSNGDAKDFC
jgi:hypothetical protein